MRISNDRAGFSLFFQWIMGVASVLVATAMIVGTSVLLQLKEDMAVLKNRPEPVTKGEFNYRMESVERRLSSLEQRK